MEITCKDKIDNDRDRNVCVFFNSFISLILLINSIYINLYTVFVSH